MASIGSLEVSLSLNASNFNGTVAQVNRNMRAMGSELQAIRARGSQYENSLTGLSQKQNVLSRSFDAASIKLQEQRRRYDELVASGTASSAQIERQANAVNQAQTQYNRLDRELSEVTEQLRIQSSQWTQVGQRMQEVGSKLSAVGDGMMNVGKKLSMYVTAPIAAMGAGAFKAAVDFESAFAGVRKTVDATESEFQYFSDEIRNMSKDIPAAATEIAKVAEAAGQLGIKNDAILGFTRTMTDMGVATNMSADEAATALARFANITKMSQQDFDKLGSTVVGLGNNFATTESEIIEMSLRLAGAGAQIGMSEADILGLATALSSVGIQAEMGGSALSRVMVRMQVAASTGLGQMDELTKKTGMSLRELQMLAANNSMDFTSLADSLGMTNKEMKNIVNAGLDLENFAKVAGMTSKQFKEMFEKDAVGAIGSFVNGLGNAEQAGESAINMLQEMGITEILLRDSLLRAGNANELFAESIDVANKAWGENVALANEAEQRYKTTESQLIILKNKLVDLGITLGNILIPFVLKMVELVEPWIEKFASLSEKTQKTILILGGLAAAIGPVLIVGGALISSIGTIISAVGGLSMAIGVAGGATTAFGATLALITGPIGWAIGAIALLTAGGIALYKNWDTIVEKNPQLLASFAALAPPVVLVVGAIKTMQDAMTPAIEQADLFGEGVSEATQKALGGYLELSDGVSKTLSEVYITSTRMTEEIASGMTKIYAEMNIKIVEGMKTRHQEELAELENFFMNSSALTTAEEEKILANRQSRNEKELEEQNLMNQRVKEILETAAAEKRALTERENQIINNYNQMMKENAVRTFSESELEQKVIMERMKENASIASAEQAAEVVRNAIKQKGEVLKEANETYNEKYKLIIKMRDETGDISAEEADKMIAEAQKSRDQTIKLAEERHEKIVSVAQKQAEEHVGKVNWETGEILSKWDMMKIGVGRKAREIIEDTKNKWEQAKKDTEMYWEAIKAWPGKKIKEMQTSIKAGMDSVKATIETNWKQAENFLKKVNLVQIGKDIINGLAKGIGDMKNAVKKKIEDIAKSIPEWAKKILDIRSPSRVMRQIGLWTGEGLVIGLNESSPKVNQAMSNIGDGILAVSKNYQKEYSNLVDEFNKKNEDKNDKTLEKIYKIRNNAAKKKRALTQKELQDIALLEASYKDKKIKADQDFNKKYKALVEKSEKEYLEVIKNYITDKKSLDEMSLIEEAVIWEQSIELFAEGSKERISAQKEYQKSVDAINKELVAINKDYQGQMQKINDDLIKQENDLTKAYQDEFNKRQSSLMSFAGLFDEFKVEVKNSGTELLSNLQSQVDGFKKWQDEFAKLASRNIDADLLAELSDLGVKALPELMALNQLTDEQLTQYSALYQEKAALAREQTEAELAGMKEDTDKQILALQEAAIKQLNILKAEWGYKIKELTSTTATELSSLQQIGADAGQGLLNGLASMEGPLISKARQIANSISSTIQQALDIHSPSRVMRGFGVNIGQGLVLGMDEMVNKVADASRRLASSVEDNAPLSSGNRGNIDNSKHFKPSVVIHTNDSGAREMERTLRRMQFAF
ncbi:phage tail tape measure protein [Lysinibacillus fusiformis]|uniref:phage tail tape measure protein n=1 Tax=Lysinibacillus fusiformis TaxID=28031 RepID=UPI001F4DDB9A|nr:phage tail tape measure protein [Lysinibacillus fusiformis]MCK1989475.1 phage tail tape measure protein [Lysinibacillus fusiformis]